MCNRIHPFVIGLKPICISYASCLICVFRPFAVFRHCKSTSTWDHMGRCHSDTRSRYAWVIQSWLFQLERYYATWKAFPSINSPSFKSKKANQDFFLLKGDFSPSYLPKISAPGWLTCAAALPLTSSLRSSRRCAEARGALRLSIFCCSWAHMSQEQDLRVLGLLMRLSK